MSKLLVVVFPAETRVWEAQLLQRLRSAGHEVAVEQIAAAQPSSAVVDRILALEALRFGPSAAAIAPTIPAGDSQANSISANLLPNPDLIIDLTGAAGARPVPVLTVEVDGHNPVLQGLAGLRSAGRNIDILARLDGRPIARGMPMLSDRIWLTRDVDQLLSAVQSLLVGAVARFASGTITEIDPPPAPPAPSPLLTGYATSLLAGLGGRALGRLKREWPFYWQTAYRLLDGPGVAETGRLDGPAFTVLPDDGERFYADPFAVEHEDRHYIFLEDFPYARGRGLISVAEISADGTCGTPYPVLQEPHHLSYPNVFSQDGSWYMIPEGGEAGEVVLYRAERFPDRWVRDTVLLEGRVFSDATLLQQGGRFWMFGTERFGKGSTSDTMAVYSAPDLRGPWLPHRNNPLLIDRAGARPGGNIVRIGQNLFLPVQDGSDGYGFGLGLRQLLTVSMDDIRLGPVRSIQAGPAWDRNGIHTLNRAGRLEVVDSTR